MFKKEKQKKFYCFKLWNCARYHKEKQVISRKKYKLHDWQVDPENPNLQMHNPLEPHVPPLRHEHNPPKLQSKSFKWRAYINIDN